MAQIVMPQFGETVTEGELTQWLVVVGERVEIDQPVAEIATDKVETEIPASVAGTVTNLLAQVGDVVPVGAPLIELASDEGEVTAGVSDPSVTQPGHAQWKDASSAEPSAAVAAFFVSNDEPGPSRKIRSTPRARRLAAQLNLDLEDLADGDRPVTTRQVSAARPTPTGAARVRDADVLVPEDGSYLVQHSRTRRVNAVRMRDSLMRALPGWSVIEVDYSAVDRSRARLGSAWRVRYGSEFTHLPYVLRAVALALREYPHLNATQRDDGLLVSEAVDLAVAADLALTGDAPPVLRGADALSVAEIALALKALDAAARSGTVTRDAFAGSTFAVIDNGSDGNVLTMSIINQPHVGILSIDAIAAQPSVVTLDDGSQGIGIRPKGHLSLAWDHRAVDAGYAAQFLARIKQLLEATIWPVDLPSGVG